MAGFFLFFLASFIYLIATRARRRERIETYRVTGMIRSPLYIVQTVLQVVLLGLMLCAPQLPHGGWPTIAFLAAILADIIALVLVRRALKWRYPI